MNGLIFQLLTGGYSQRRAAMDLRLNRKTIIRKFIFMGKFALGQITYLNHLHEPERSIEFDELETFEHSKLKPLSIHLAVSSATRRILGFRVARMPAKGRLAHLSRKKYGPRIDERITARREFFMDIKAHVDSKATIKSDMNPHYPSDVKEHFPEAEHLVFKGRRGCVVGQGELKSGGFDPLFSLNHTCAMLRANINRLFRRTWCTTKKPESLALHIALYVLKHNLILIHNTAK